MKWPGYTLLIYLLFIAVFPCCAIDQCPDEKIKTEQAANHENGDEDCGSCSPFFNCEGCATVSATVEPVYFKIDNLPAQRVFTGFLFPSIPDISYGFWQPPK